MSMPPKYGPIFEYGVFDKNGLIGVKEDAPDEVKELYKEFAEIQKEAAEDGRKL